MLKFYILKKKQPKEVGIQEWARFMGNAERRLRVTELVATLDDTFLETVFISTIFLGLNTGANDHPAFFETMVFGGVSNALCVRSATYEDALKNHEHVIDKVGQAHYKAKRLLNRELETIMPIHDQTLTIKVKEAIY
jgi:hypothetical protein